MRESEWENGGVEPAERYEARFIQVFDFAARLLHIVYVSYLHMVDSLYSHFSSLRALLDRTFSFSLHKTPSREASDQWKPVVRLSFDFYSSSIESVRGIRQQVSGEIHFSVVSIILRKKILRNLKHFYVIVQGDYCEKARGLWLYALWYCNSVSFRESNFPKHRRKNRNSTEKVTSFSDRELKFILNPR